MLPYLPLILFFALRKAIHKVTYIIHKHVITEDIISMLREQKLWRAEAKENVHAHALIKVSPTSRRYLHASRRHIGDSDMTEM